jgi:hypothetical protein
MLKKVFITSVIFLLIALSIAGYFVFFSNKTAGPVTTVPNTDSPFGPGSGDRPINTSTPDTPADVDIVIPIVGVTQISTVPSASGFSYTSGGATIVRYVERGQGHMNEVNLRTGTTSRLSNTTLPKIQETVWTNKGESTIFRYLTESNTIRTYAATLGKKSTTTSIRTLKGSFLPGNIESIVASPDLKKIFYLERTSTGIRGSVANFDGSNRKQILNSAFGEWIVEWPEANTITLTSKASSGIPGYMYFLNASTGSMKKILGPISGLTTKTNPSLTYIAYTDSTARLQVYNIKSGITSDLVPQTVMDKCVWSPKIKTKLFCGIPQSLPNGIYPDAWFQGRVVMNDSLFEINVDSSSYVLLEDNKNITRRNIDINEITTNPAGDYLILTNRRDSTLWAIDLNS